HHNAIRHDVSSRKTETMASGTAAVRRLIHVLHAKDNVATALADLAPGSEVESEVPGGAQGESQGGGAVQRIAVRAPIAFGHKIALVPIARGEPVVKYGEVIGLATQDIRPGDHVHVHNVESPRG